LKKNLKIKKNIILMHFKMKNTLKNNRNYTPKQVKFDKIFLFLASEKKERAKKKTPKMNCQMV
jgi:hypothetical protein